MITHKPRYNKNNDMIEYRPHYEIWCKNHRYCLKKISGFNLDKLKKRAIKNGWMEHWVEWYCPDCRKGIA